MWPVQATAFLVGISLLGAQGPLSTYAGTDRSLGYGLGLDATERSYLIGIYLVSLIIGAVLFAVTSRKASPRIVLIVALVFFAIAGLAGLAITIRTEQWWFLAVGMIAMGILNVGRALFGRNKD